MRETVKKFVKIARVLIVLYPEEGQTVGQSVSQSVKIGQPVS